MDPYGAGPPREGCHPGRDQVRIPTPPCQARHRTRLRNPSDGAWSRTGSIRHPDASDRGRSTLGASPARRSVPDGMACCPRSAWARVRAATRRAPRSVAAGSRTGWFVKGTGQYRATSRTTSALENRPCKCASAANKSACAATMGLPAARAAMFRFYAPRASFLVRRSHAARLNLSRQRRGEW